jgi:hypothetical protein
MKKAVLGMSVAALLASAAWANDQSEDARVAAADPSVAAFKKLDADADKRLSAIEAANDTNVAASFTRADVDKDGYLTIEEFETIQSSDNSASAPQSESETTTEPSTTTEPQ